MPALTRLQNAALTCLQTGARPTDVAKALGKSRKHIDNLKRTLIRRGYCLVTIWPEDAIDW